MSPLENADYVYPPEEPIQPMVPDATTVSMNVGLDLIKSGEVLAGLAKLVKAKLIAVTETPFLDEKITSIGNVARGFGGFTAEDIAAVAENDVIKTELTKLLKIT